MKFLADLEQLKNLDGVVSTRKTIAIGEVTSLEQAVCALRKAQSDLSTVFNRFRAKIFEDPGFIEDEETVSTASLRELMIRNRVAKLTYSNFQFKRMTDKQAIKDEILDSVKKRIQSLS